MFAAFKRLLGNKPTIRDRLEATLLDGGRREFTPDEVESAVRLLDSGALDAEIENAFSRIQFGTEDRGLP